MKKNISIFLVYFISILYLEFLLRILTMSNIFMLSNIVLILFTLSISFLLTFITKLFGEKGGKTVFFIITSFNFFWFAASYVLKTFFGFYLTFSAFNLADQIANGFTSDAVTVVICKIGGILLFALPLLFAILFHKKINFNKYKPLGYVGIFLFFLISTTLYYFSLQINKNSDYSPYVLFFEKNDLNANIEKVSVINTLCIDTYRSIFGFEDKIVEEEQKEVEPPKKKEVVYEPITLDIDFDQIIANNKDSAVKSMSEYFKSSTGTYQNKYTGQFKGKNLILFMAESFNGVAVSKELTPTLYKLANNGFSFEKFYTPTIYSTIGGEFQELTGLYANSLTLLKKFRSGKTDFKYGIGNLFKDEGYKTYAYHDSTTTFQDRNKYLAALGFSTFEGCNSKTNTMTCSWPGSDIEMIDKTIDKYAPLKEETIPETTENSTGNNTETKKTTETKKSITETNKNTETNNKKVKSDSEPFLVFYASVSGHGDYTSSSKYYKKYKQQVNAYYPNASVESKAYVAGQMELDRALEELLKLLEERGILDDTVIALVGDHAPYYLYQKSMDYINEISTYKRDSKIELFRSNFILYNSKMETVPVSKVGSQIDVIPTLYNLFGLKYDSRLFAGNDILSTEPGLAIMSDNSWVSDEGYYIASSGKFTQTSENELEEDYVSKINSKVKNKKTISENLLIKDYYGKIVYKQEETNTTDDKKIENTSKDLNQQNNN